MHIKDLGPKNPHYLIMYHFSRHIIHHNSHKIGNYFLNKYVTFFAFTLSHKGGEY